MKFGRITTGVMACILTGAAAEAALFNVDFEGEVTSAFTDCVDDFDDTVSCGIDTGSFTGSLTYDDELDFGPGIFEITAFSFDLPGAFPLITEVDAPGSLNLYDTNTVPASIEFALALDPLINGVQFFDSGPFFVNIGEFDISDTVGIFASGTLSPTSAVPLPGALALMATGLLGLGAVRRRNQRKNKAEIHG